VPNLPAVEHRVPQALPGMAQGHPSGCGEADLKHKSVDRAKRVSNQCRNHGSCPWCRRSRTRSARMVAAMSLDALREYVSDRFVTGKSTWERRG